MIPAIAALSMPGGRQRLALASIAALTASFSFFVHYRGANAEEVMNEWHAWPISLGDMPERIWDWSDIQFLRGIKWGPPTDLGVAGVPVRQFDRATYGLMGTNNAYIRKFNADTSLIAPAGQTWLAIADAERVGPEISALFQDVIPRAELRTIGSDVPYRLYQFNLGDRLLQAAQLAQQRVWYSADLVPDPTKTQSINLPARFGSVVDLIGYQVITTSQPGTVTTLTYWRVVKPSEEPLRLFVHALNADAQIVAQGDRWDTPAQDWRPGDLVAQVNRLTLPSDAGRIWIEIGLYHPDSGERLSAIAADSGELDRLLLGVFPFP